MDNRTRTVTSSGAFSLGGSQYIGVVRDDYTILNYEGIDLLTGEIIDPDYNAMVMVKQREDETDFNLYEENLKLFTELHLPPFKTVMVNVNYCVRARKINLEHVEVIIEESFINLASEVDTPIELHLDNVIEIGGNAFGGANAIIYLNKNVKSVADNAFEGIETLHYSGNLPGAPWGAQEWIQD